MNWLDRTPEQELNRAANTLDELRRDVNEIKIVVRYILGLLLIITVIAFLILRKLP